MTKIRPGAFHPHEAAEHEHHAALVFAQDAYRRRRAGYDQDDDRQDIGEKIEIGMVTFLRPAARRAASGRRRRSTRTGWPGAQGRGRARRPDLAVDADAALGRPASRHTGPSGRSSAPRPSRPGGGARAAIMPSRPARTERALVTAAPTTTGQATAKAVSAPAGSNRNIEPTTKATMPPMPSTPNAGVKASAAINADAEQPAGRARRS